MTCRDCKQATNLCVEIKGIIVILKLYKEKSSWMYPVDPHRRTVPVGENRHRPTLGELVIYKSIGKSVLSANRAVNAAIRGIPDATRTAACFPFSSSLFFLPPSLYVWVDRNVSGIFVPVFTSDSFQEMEHLYLTLRVFGRLWGIRRAVTHVPMHSCSTVMYVCKVCTHHITL
jgi:hypothetical protein